MPRYSKLEEVDNVVYGAGDCTWTPKRLIDRLIIEKAAFSLLTDLGDRVPLLEDQDDITQDFTHLGETKRKPFSRTPLILARDLSEEKITVSKSGSKTSRIKRMIGRLFKMF